MRKTKFVHYKHANTRIVVGMGNFHQHMHKQMDANASGLAADREATAAPLFKAKLALWIMLLLNAQAR